MSTPASQALSGSGGAPSSPGGSGSAAPDAKGSGGGTAPASSSAANQPFFESWIPAGETDTRTWLQNKNFADPGTLVKSYRAMETEAANLRTAASVKGYPAPEVKPDGTVIAPNENAVKAWRMAMGVPEKSDAYDIQPPKDSPYPQFTTYLKDVLHQANTPPAMAKLLAQGYESAVVKLETELRAQEDQASAAALKQLEETWGSNYKERVAIGNRGLAFIEKEVGGLSDIQRRTLEVVLGTDKFMTMMWKFGAGNKEIASPADAGKPAGFEGGASAAQAEWDSIMAARTQGTISNFDWNKPENVKHRNDLAERIAAGNAPTMQ